MTAVPKMNVIRDKAYRQFANEVACEAAFNFARPHDCEGDVVLAHIRIAGNCGTGMKPSDDESLFLCHRHHMEFDQSPDRADWLVRNILIPQRKAAYRRWCAER